MGIYRRFWVPIFTCLFIVFALLSVFLVQQLEQKLASEQIKHQAQLINLVSLNPSATHKQLIKNIKSSFDYSSLEFKDQNNHQIYFYQDDKTTPSVSLTLFELLSLKYQAVHTRFETTDLQLIYKLKPNHLYIETDQMIKTLGLIFCVLSFLLAAIAQFFFNRIVLKAQSIIELQNEEANEAHFNQLPKSVLSLAKTLKISHENLLVQIKRWKDSAKTYQQAILTDDLTGLSNRIEFVKHFEQQLTVKEENNFGLLAIARVTNLAEINQNLGFLDGNDYLIQTAQVLNQQTKNYTNGKCFRLNGTDFGLLLPNLSHSDAVKFGEKLSSQLKSINQNSEEIYVYVGMVLYQSGNSMGELMALADTGISIAQTKQESAWHIQKDKSVLDNISAKYGNQNWKAVIADVIDNQRIQLYNQVIEPTNKSSLIYNELLARFTSHTGHILPTETFVSMATRMGKIIEIDKLIIEQAIEFITANSESKIAINLSSAAIQDEAFFIWLERRLLRSENLSTSFIFEVSEGTISKNLDKAQRLINMLHRCGAKLTVEHFGVSFMSLKFFQSFKPDYIKLDASLCRHINEDLNNQYYVRILIDIAHRLGVSVLAESVETLDEKQVLQQMFIDGCQGYLIAKPKSIENSLKPCVS